MMNHYLKTAFRNIRKYRQQNIISIIGLAIGFVCFALSVLWIRYELSYDNFHEGADRIYRVRITNERWEGNLCLVTPYLLSSYLKSTWPEVEDACALNSWDIRLKVDNKLYDTFALYIDSSFYDIFSVKVIEGNLDFIKSKAQGIAITPELATRMFGNENAIGKTIQYSNQQLTVDALVEGWGMHSNMSFQCIMPLRIYAADKWDTFSYRTYICLKEGAEREKFEQKVRAFGEREELDGFDFSKIVFTPIKELHYTFPDEDSRVKFSHVFLFALSGLLVILCSLFNYLTLFINCLKIRSKEFALRKTNGATNQNLFLMLMCEIGIMLILAVTVGLILIEWSLPMFKHLSGVDNSTGHIYMETLSYGVLIVAATILLVLLPVMMYFRRQTLYSSLKDTKDGIHKNLFRKVSIVLQLFISIGFIYCTMVIYKQVDSILHADTGIDQQNTATVGCYPLETKTLYQELKQLPEVQEVIMARAGFLPANSTSHNKLKPEEKSQKEDPSTECEIKYATADFISFYRIPFVEGRTFNESSKEAKEVIINEKARNAFGWTSGIGHRIVDDRGVACVVVGVVKDFVSTSPTEPTKPIVFLPEPGEQICLIRYLPGKKEACCQAVEERILQKFPDTDFSIYTVEDTLEEYVKSESALFSMLGFVSVVCIVVSLFGIYSLAMLICERRRKEIAIRKVLGASTGSILLLFYREFFVLLGIASALAFSISYVIMKPWREQYIRQVAIGPEVYAGIFLSMLACIVLTIDWLVWRTAHINPAEVIKSE
ncbi:ABC transporter permease [Parabacteroides pacaensis]|uniref:ABC transporter permease n=1 Tax=Parabacteroides pacaensis TaxID=2086575 RepID=UPI000D0F02D6|nr:ABC transporter permease [Parabacteroides pacaensis]